jgi:hypothetical protein
MRNIRLTIVVKADVAQIILAIVAALTVLM